MHTQGHHAHSRTFMHVGAHTATHAHIHTLVHIHAHIHIHSCTWTLKDTYTWTLMHTHGHSYTRVLTHGHAHTPSHAYTLTVWRHSREQRASTGSGSVPLSPSPHSVPVPATRASLPGPSSSPWPSRGVAQPCPGLSMPLHPAGAWRTSSLPLTPVRAPQPPGLPGTCTSVSRLPSSRPARLAGQPGDLPPEPCPASTPVLEPSAPRGAWLDSAQLHPSAVWATLGQAPRAPRPARAARLVAQASLCLQPG